MLILDRYILRRYIFTLLFALISFAAIFIIVDNIENLDKFIDKACPLPIIILFYVYYLPEIIKLVLPVAVLLAGLFTIGQMARHNELTALKSSGISLYRTFAPLFFFICLLSICSFYYNESIVTVSNRRRWEIDRVYLRKLPPSYFTRRNDIYIQDSPNRTIIIGYFDGEKKIGYEVDIISHTASEITERTLAKEIHYEKNGWQLFKGVQRNFAADQETMKVFSQNEDKKLNIEPQDLEGIQIRPEEMNYRELTTFIEKLRRVGGEIDKWQVQRHQKISFPFSFIIIAIFSLTLASSQWRGGTAGGISISLFLCFIYYGLNISLGPILGQKGIFPPLIAAWLGNMLFGILAIWTIARMKQ